MDLSGIWRGAPADDDLRREYAAVAFDHDGWEAVPVPGHWRSVPAFAAFDGPVLYRHRFESPPPEEGERDWLVLDGIFYQGDVWMDGEYVGDPEGYFFPHAFEVTDLTRGRAEHVLAVEATCAPQHDKAAKRNLTGVFQHWDCLDPDWNPGGLWRPVRLERTGPARIDRLRVLCREAESSRAVMALSATIEADTARSAIVRTTFAGLVERELEQPLAAGSNEVAWTFGVEEPALWWPWSLGDQPLHDVTVEVVLDGVVSHRRTVRTGLRQIGVRNWVFSVNGERIFLKGANAGPTRMALGDASEAELARDVELAKEAGLDFVRVHAHVSRPELYEAADRAGVLLWQDLPLQWGYARSVKQQAVRQAAAAVDLLAHHPSVFVWCAHNEPLTLPVEPGRPMGATRLAMRFAAGQQLPSWNKTVLDRRLRRTLGQHDDTRPVVAHSGVLPHLPQLDGTDSHLYFGWYHGDERDLPGLAASVPRMVRFVSEFGAQAVPEHADFMEPHRWPDLDWAHLERHHALQKRIFDQRVPPEAYASFDQWRAATQGYQATLLKHHVEALRRLKYRPTGGFAMFALTDAMPAVSWSVLGHDRAAKAGYHALAEACRPVIVVADRPPTFLAPGTALGLDVHVVSDLREPLEGAEVVARVSWPGGSHSWRYRGDVPADAVVRVGTLQLVVPDVPGDLVLDLELHHPVCAVTNRYEGVIRPG